MATLKHKQCKTRFYYQTNVIHHVDPHREMTPKEKNNLIKKYKMKKQVPKYQLPG